MLHAILKANPKSNFMYVVDTRPKVSQKLFRSIKVFFLPFFFSMNLTLKVPLITKLVCFCCLLKCFNNFKTNSVEADQTAPEQSDLGPHCLSHTSIKTSNVSKNMQQMV